ncbi:response regulator [Terriglobus aquaticus]|uniref:Response regulator n=1 Tax=Terriglobus aquaticus TaxID=940139 RepID=A0ABW9KJQ1_9BACT|nr:response regulator [Terriglobus aquaticus]
MANHTHTFDKTALSGVRVLIVDDEPVLASTFCLVLQLAGAYARSAEHGALALATLETERFDLILCDKHMPVMTGPEFIRELNRRGDTTPILLFINAADYSSMEQIRDLRIDGTLAKPLLPAELVQAIRETLRRNA